MSRLGNMLRALAGMAGSFFGMGKKSRDINYTFQDKKNWFNSPDRNASMSGGNKGLEKRLIKRRAAFKAARTARRKLRQWPKHSMRRT